MSFLEGLVAKLAQAQEGLFRAADAISAEQWKTSPGNESWSAGELVAHLAMVERRIVATADRAMQRPPVPIPVYKRFHLPLKIVSARLIRRKSPIALDPSTVLEKEAMLAELRAARGRTLSFLEETKNRDLTRYCWPHPFIGMLNFYEWIEFIAAHQLRHTKQMKEIAGNLPKVVSSLQK